MAKNKLISDAAIISMYANQFSFLTRPLTRDMTQSFDAGIVGLPFDLATTGRAGARSGPNAVRQAAMCAGKAGVGHDHGLLMPLNI
tara:strand:- start:589 stop:846 length:258 start_codon:yes stop_codon:yes gene_type:complete